MTRTRMWSFSVMAGVMMGLLTMPQPDAFGKEITWKFSSYVASSNQSLGATQKWWCEQVEKRSNGQLKVKMYWNDELCGAKEMMQTVKSGVADVVGHAPPYTPGETPVWNLLCLPFVNPQQLDHLLLTISRLTRESKPFIDEMNKFNCIYGGAHTGGSVNFMGKKAVRNVEELKGKRIRCMPDAGKILRSFGATPVMIPAAEMYTSLDSGILDLIAFSVDAFRMFKIDEISKYLMVDVDMGAQPCCFFINKTRWNELPEELKKVVQGVIDDLPRYVWGLLHNPEAQKRLWSGIQEKNIEVIPFPKGEREKLVAKSPEIWQEAVNRSGDPKVAKAALEDYFRVRDQVLKEFPNGDPSVRGSR